MRVTVVLRGGQWTYVRVQENRSFLLTLHPFLVTDGIMKERKVCLFFPYHNIYIDYINFNNLTI